MKKKLQKILTFKALGAFMVTVLLLFGSTGVNAQFSATWPFTSGLTSTVTGASSGNLTASTATYTSGTGGLFTGVVSYTGVLNGTGISGKASSATTSLYNAVGSTSPITPFLEYKLAPNAGYSMTTNSFSFTVEQTTAISGVSIAAGYSVDGGATFTGLLAPTGGGTSPTLAISPSASTWGTTAGTLTFTVPAATVAALNSLVLRVVVWRNSASNSSTANLKISPPVITGTTPVSATPAISSGTPFTAFTYVSGSGPSTSQSTIITGSNLSGPITINTTTLTNFEVSLDNFATAPATGIITVTSGTAISVRLKTGLSVGSYSDIVNVQSASDSYTLPLSCTGTVSPLYVYSGSGVLSNTANWSPVPPSFTATNSTYSIPSSATTDFTWALGSGSKIIVGNGTLAANLTIDPGFSISGGSIDVSAVGTLTVAHATSPTLGTLNATSTVEYTAATAAVPSSKTFGNLRITGATSVATQASGITTVAGNFTLSNGAIYKIGNASSGSILSVAGDFNASGTGGITTTSVITAATSATLTLTGTGKNIDNTASTNDYSKLNLNINGTYNLANDFNYNTTSATSRAFTIGASGSLNLSGKKLTLDNSGSIAITSGGTFTANGTGSTVEYNSTAAQTLPTAVNYNNLTINAAGIKTLSGATTVNSTLSILGVSTIATGATGGFNLTVNSSFTLSENSTITLGTGSHNVAFSASNAATWAAGKTLTVTGWAGTAGASGTAGKIFFGTTSGALTAQQLSQIVFNISSVNYSAAILSTGEVVPTFTVLPVRLLSFTGKKENNVIQLNWSTASETNNQRFDILRAGADKSFQKIGEVNGNGNTNATLYYNFSDRKPLTGINYYKLSQVDFDGQTQEFGPIAIASDLNAASLEVYAAPDHSQIIVFINSNETKEASLNIFDVSGRSLIKQSVSLQEGINKFIIPANGLNKGMHLVEFSSKEGRLIRKFIN